MPQTVRTTLEQGRAKYAYECAEQGKSCHSNKVQIQEFRNEYFKDSQYKSYVKKIPMMIKTNGLGATFAFVLSKGTKQQNKKLLNPGDIDNPKNAYDLIYLQTAQWIAEKDIFDYNNGTDFSMYIVNQNSSTYRALTIEVLAFFNWLRRFAEGLIAGEDE